MPTRKQFSVKVSSHHTNKAFRPLIILEKCDADYEQGNLNYKVSHPVFHPDIYAIIIILGIDRICLSMN